MTVLGFCLFAIRPSTVELQDVPWLVISGCAISLFAMAYGWFRYLRRQSVIVRQAP